MSDKPMMAVMAHAGAESTVLQFLPRWSALDVRLVGCYPSSDKLPGLFPEEISAGPSSHSGYRVFRRFCDTLEALLATGEERFVVIEYDCVPLVRAVPPVFTGPLACSVVVEENSPRLGGNSQTLCLPPWCGDKYTMRALLKACLKYLDDDGDAPWCRGLLDRWIGAVAARESLAVYVLGDVAWYAPFLGQHWIRERGCKWVHGWKDRELFGNLWDLWDTETQAQ